MTEEPVHAAPAVADRLGVIPPDEERVLLSTGKYIGPWFDDARLDTLMLTLPDLDSILAAILRALANRQRRRS